MKKGTVHSSYKQHAYYATNSMHNELWAVGESIWGTWDFFLMETKCMVSSYFMPNLKKSLKLELLKKNPILCIFHAISNPVDNQVLSLFQKRSRSYIFFFLLLQHLQYGVPIHQIWKKSLKRELLKNFRFVLFLAMSDLAETLHNFSFKRVSSIICTFKHMVCRNDLFLMK